MVKEKEFHEVRKPNSFSMTIKPISISMEDFLAGLIHQQGSKSKVFEKAIEKYFNKDIDEIKKELRDHLLFDMMKLDEKNVSESFRKIFAETLIEMEQEKEMKNDLKNYIKKGEYKR